MSFQPYDLIVETASGTDVDELLDLPPASVLVGRRGSL
jgi:hypothetical protein